MYYSKMKQIPMNAELTATELTLHPQTSGSGKKIVIDMEDVLGAAVEKGGGYFRVFECKKMHKKKLHRTLVEHTFRVAAERMNEADAPKAAATTTTTTAQERAQMWCQVIRYLASPLTSDVLSVADMCANPPKTRSFLILLNPVGGSGKAVKLYRKSSSLVFKRAGITTTEVITQAAEEAVAMAAKLDLEAFDCVVAVGGDGFLAEVIQGLMQRTDWLNAIRMPLGVLPAGSGNGLAHTLAAAAKEKCDGMGSAFMLAKGRPRGLDISTVRSLNDTFYSFLSFEWAMIANIDLESDKFRCLGSARFTVTAVVKLCGSQKWFGKLSYLPSDDTDTVVAEPEEFFCSDPTESSPVLDLLPDLKATEIPPTWKSVEGQFGLVWAVSCSHAAGDAQVYPKAQFDDGYMYLVYAKGPLKFSEMASILLKLEDGSFLNLKKVHVVRTRAFQIETQNPIDLMAVDGELWGTAKTQVQVHRKLGRIMSF